MESDDLMDTSLFMLIALMGLNEFKRGVEIFL
jgi:hypothetical protein